MNEGRIMNIEGKGYTEMRTAHQHQVGAAVYPRPPASKRTPASSRGGGLSPPACADNQTMPAFNKTP
jgi:hypothetical protein